MNKKIYLNHNYLLFEKEEATGPQYPQLKVYHKSDEKTLDKIVAEFLDPLNTFSIKIASGDDFEKILDRLKKSFSYIEAAGGFIEKEKEFLFIHRHGRWDLPKGKLEKQETIEHAAVRECEEECGVQRLTILHALPSTFHIYPYKSGYALKQTYWFYMRTDYTQQLTPQLEEDIDQVKWFTQKEIESAILKDTYYTIADTVKAALKL